MSTENKVKKQIITKYLVLSLNAHKRKVNVIVSFMQEIKCVSNTLF